MPLKKQKENETKNKVHIKYKSTAWIPSNDQTQGVRDKIKFRIQINNGGNYFESDRERERDRERDGEREWLRAGEYVGDARDRRGE